MFALLIKIGYINEFIFEVIVYILSISFLIWWFYNFWVNSNLDKTLSKVLDYVKDGLGITDEKIKKE